MGRVHYIMLCLARNKDVSSLDMTEEAKGS